MYKSFFGLKENPFNVNPDPRFLFLTKQIEEALSGLMYGIQARKGFITLTGEVGTGKTTLVNRLLDWLHMRRTKTAFLFNSRMNSSQLFDFILAEFDIQCDHRSKSQQLMKLNHWLDSAADQPGDLDREIAANRAVRAAGTGREIEIAATSATAAANYAALQDHADEQGTNERLRDRTAEDCGCGGRCFHLFAEGDGSDTSIFDGNSAGDQSAVRTCADQLVCGSTKDH